MRPSLYVAHLDRRETIADVLEAALADLPVVLALAEEPPSARSCSVELRAPGVPEGIRLLAQLDARLSGQRYRMRLRPLNDEHAGELLALLSRERSQLHKLPARAALAVEGGARRALAYRESYHEPRPTLRGRRRNSDRPTLRRSEPPVGLRRSEPARAPQAAGQNAAVRSSLVGRTLGGAKYVIEAPLARSRLARVYRARYVSLDEPVAIHLVEPAIDAVPELRRRIHLGARAVGRLEHPNLARVLDCGDEDDGTLFLVTELLEGESLASVLARQAPLPLARVVALGSQLAAALAAAHARGLPHPLLHPECVTLLADGDAERLVVDDLAYPGEALLALTVEQRGAAFSRYLAPERPQRHDARSDVYALGAILHHMALGEPPAAASDAGSAEQAAPRVRRPGVDRALAGILERATRSAAADRYASASELREALLELARGAAPAVGAATQAAASDATAPAVQAAPRKRVLRERPPSTSIAEAALSATLDEAVRAAASEAAVEPRPAMYPPPTPSLAANGAALDARTAGAAGESAIELRGASEEQREIERASTHASARSSASMGARASTSTSTSTHAPAGASAAQAKPLARRVPSDDFSDVLDSVKPPPEPTSASSLRPPSVIPARTHHATTRPPAASLHAPAHTQRSSRPPARASHSSRPTQRPPALDALSLHPPALSSSPPLRTSAAPATLGDVAPLAHAASGFADFFVAFTAASARTTYYAPEHPEHGHASGRLLGLAEQALRGRGELSLIRHARDEQPQLSVASGLGELLELRRAIASGVGETFGARLSELLARREIASLTLKEGIGVAELVAVTELLSGPELASDVLRAEFLHRELAHVSVLFDAELLGSARTLPLHLRMCISRIARDLGALPLVRGLDVEQRRALRLQLVRDVVRGLRADQIGELLANADLIGEALRRLPELADVDVPLTIAASLRATQCLRVIEQLVPVLAHMLALGRELRAAEAAALPETDPRRIALALARRLTDDPAPDARAALRLLHDAGLLPLHELPFEMQVDRLGERMADRLSQHAAATLAAIAPPSEPARYAQDMQVLARASIVLARGGLLDPLAAVVGWLRQRASSEQPEESLAASQALAALGDPRVLAPIASVLIGSKRHGPAERDAAHAILLALGAQGARALCDAHEALASDDIRRVAFVRTLREIGELAVPVVAATLAKHAARGADVPATLLEDLLRALPERPDHELGTQVAPLLHHDSSAVQRSAMAALVPLWGSRAIPPLLVAFEEADDSVRVALLTTLRKLAAIDSHVVRRIDALLAGLEPAGAELRVAAAAALADALPDARPLAQHVLRDELARNQAGLPSFELRGGDDPDMAALDVRNLMNEEGRARIKRAVRTAMKRDVRTLLGSAESAEAVLEACCASLLALGDPEDRKLIESRIAHTTGRLKDRLTRLL